MTTNGYDGNIGRIRFLFRHGVVPASMPRMAFGQPRYAHHAASQHTTFADSVSGVLGAAWEEAAARPEHRADAVLVGFDQAQGGDLSDVAFAGSHAGIDGAVRGACASDEAATAADFAM